MYTPFRRVLYSVFHCFKNRGDEKTGIQDHSLPRLQIYFQAVLFPEFQYQAYQPLAVIIFPGDMMAPSQVKPFKARQIVSELFLQRRKRRLEGIGILLTERVKMKSIQIR